MAGTWNVDNLILPTNGGAFVGQNTNTDITFKNCCYCADYISPARFTPDDDNTAYTFINCGAFTKSQMTMNGFAAGFFSNDGSVVWTNKGQDNYPDFTEKMPVAVSRLHRGDEYLPLNEYGLYYNGVRMTVTGLAAPDDVFDPALFTIAGPETGGLELELEYLTVNGTRFTEPVRAGDFTELNFSAVVDNTVSRDLVQPALEEANEIYAGSAKLYSPSSRAMLKTAINGVQAALDDHYLTITRDEGEELVASLAAIEMEKFLYRVTLAAGNATTYCLAGGDWVETGSEYRMLGEQITLKAEPDAGYKFLYWKDTAGNRISEDSEFVYTVNRTTTITAVTAPDESYTFTYKDVYGKIYKTQAVSDYSQVAYPVAVGAKGLRTGYIVKAWTNDYPGELPAEGEVTGNVIFTASFTKEQTFYEVNCKAGDDENTVRVKAATVFSATAPETYNGTAFSYWKNTDTDRIISYSAGLSVSVYSDMNVEAVYNGAAEGVLTVAVLQQPIAQAAANKISFVGQAVYGDDIASEIMHGVLLLKSDEPVTDLVLDTPGVIVGKSSGYSGITKTFIINKTRVWEGEVYYGRAFIIYNDVNGEQKVAYSDIKGASF